MLKNLFFTVIFIFCAISTFAQDIINRSKTVEFQGEKSLSVKVEFAAGNLKIKKGDSDRLFYGAFAYSSNDLRPVIEYEMDETTKKGRLLLKIERDKDEKEGEVEDEEKDWNLKIEENEWILYFSDEVPINFDIQAGASECEIDFTDLQVSGLFMDMGAGNTTVEFDKPNKVEMERMKIKAGITKLRMENLMNANVQHFDFAGGVGQFTLDFAGEIERKSYADISLGVGQMTILVPETLGTEIKTESFFLSPLSIDEFDKRENNVYRNKSFGSTSKQLIIKLKGGLGSLNVETIEGK